MGTTLSEPLPSLPAPGSGAPRDVVRAARRKSSWRAMAVVAALLAAYSIWAITDGGLKLYLQRAFDGISSGVLYGAVALALVLVFKATRIINFSQGALAMFGTYLAYTAWDSLGLPLGLAIVAAMIVSAIGAAGVERAVIRPFDAENHLAITIVTRGIYLGVNALAALIWGFDPKGFPSPFPHGKGDHLSIDGARIGYDALGAIGLVLLVVIAVSLLLSRTRLGLAMRTVANSAESARLLGIDVGRSVQASWALAAAAGTLAGCLAASTTYLEPGFMDKVLVYAFAAATLGGLDSIVGALVGGILVGLSTSLVTGYIDALGSQFGLAFLLIIAVLQFKPAGLFGRRYLERV
jgi:branched-chain amino acid transport system permease protein